MVLYEDQEIWDSKNYLHIFSNLNWMFSWFLMSKALFRVLMSLILWNLRNWSEFSYQNLALDLGGGILEQKLYRDEFVSTIWDQRIGPSLSLAWPRLVQCSRPNRLRRAQKILGLCSGWTILKGHRPGQSPVFLGLSYHYFLGLGSSVKYCNTYPLYFFSFGSKGKLV